MRESLKRLRPDRFEDIIAMVALYRPGPMDNIPTYINRKHGEEPVDCLHPMLEGILKETYGVIIYQEQVMQIAQVMAGYTLGQADLLRRAMGKKDKAEMARQQARFVEGAMKNGVKKDDAEYIFELVDKFAGYGFNKSHAAAYALVSYHTAYMKANFREEFLAASMTLDMGNTDKLAMFAAEAKKSGIEVKPPCVNASDVEFLAEPARTPGAARRHPLFARRPEEHRRVRGRDDRCGARRPASPMPRSPTSPRASAPRRSTSARSRRWPRPAPSMRSRPTARSSTPTSRAFWRWRSGARRTPRRARTISSASARPPRSSTCGRRRPGRRWSGCQHEFDAVGFYLSGHPLDSYERVLQKLGVKRYAEFELMTERGSCEGRLAGIVISARERRSQKGNKFAFAMFSDMTGQFEAVVFSDTLAQCGDLLEPGTPVLLRSRRSATATPSRCAWRASRRSTRRRPACSAA